MKILKVYELNDLDPYDEEIWDENLKELLDNLLVILIRRGWRFDLTQENDRYYLMEPPSNLRFEKKYRLYVPKSTEKNDFDSNINKVINILMEIYGDDREDYIK